jgi:structural maintenance of chromosomes protein 5
MKTKIYAYQNFVTSSLDLSGMRVLLQEKKQELKDIEDTHQAVRKRYEEAKAALAAIIVEAKEKKQQAITEVESHHVDYDDSNPKFYKCDESGMPPSELKDDGGYWREISDDQDDLRAEIAELKKEVEATSNKRDKSVLVEFEATKKALVSATKKLDDFKQNASAGQKQLQDQIDTWTASITNVVDKINIHFSKLMTDMSYGGGVKLTDHADFKKVGIDISVQYREGEGLQTLSGGQHSGGERAVSTITYLLAVQQLTSAPLRMVDEINQGMDATNERHAYNAVGDICGTDEGKTQFWLFSPKLLMNEKRFRYPEDITVLLVQGGPHMIPSKNWNMEQIIAAEEKKKSGVKKSPSKKKRKTPSQDGRGNTKKKKK